jgi:trans-aconitate 2-methyltransferase
MHGVTGESTDSPETVYSFGETELAAHRLGLVARIFDPVSEEFLSAALNSRPRLALDLGCGPGFMTRLLANVAERAVGVDRSEDFLERARSRASSFESYVAADITDAAEALPVPGGSPDLIYLRLLASHLPRPEREICRWVRRLEPGGLLLLEDFESIDTEIEPFERYLRLVAAMLDHHGNELYVGPRLATADWGGEAQVDINRTVEVSPDTAFVARMFRMNLRIWRRDPYVEAAHARRVEEDLLAGELERIAEEPPAVEITWRLRQISLRRPAYDLT